jgi:nuclear cap-binding protein subunit 1
MILLANARKPEFTPEILSKVGEALQKHLNLGEWREVKLYLRLLGGLQGMFEGDGVFPILDELFSRAADLQMKSSEDVSLKCCGSPP